MRKNITKRSSVMGTYRPGVGVGRSSASSPLVGRQHRMVDCRLGMKESRFERPVVEGIHFVTDHIADCNITPIEMEGYVWKEERDGGRMWKKHICSKLVFFDIIFNRWSYDEVMNVTIWILKFDWHCAFQ
ncbi:unnamed protein product [Lactuca saligna]|uniref:Uncharacterized protein n=1 Tax=Lactuca saligna TaxID=75948 RepID=A0AA35YS64_LACSI|nr:unnamed protein product [Lactuca saligna]